MSEGFAFRHSRYRTYSICQHKKTLCSSCLFYCFHISRQLYVVKKFLFYSRIATIFLKEPKLEIPMSPHVRFLSSAVSLYSSRLFSADPDPALTLMHIRIWLLSVMQIHIPIMDIGSITNTAVLYVSTFFPDCRLKMWELMLRFLKGLLNFWTGNWSGAQLLSKDNVNLYIVKT